MRFFFGFAIGVGLGLLFAPASGEETRRRLMNKADELAAMPRQKAMEMAEVGQERAGEIGAEVGRKAAEAAVEALKDNVLKDKTSQAV